MTTTLGYRSRATRVVPRGSFAAASHSLDAVWVCRPALSGNRAASGQRVVGTVS